MSKFYIMCLPVIYYVGREKKSGLIYLKEIPFNFVVDQIIIRDYIFSYRAHPFLNKCLKLL